MIIRLEDTKDYREVENLTREAFWNVYRPACRLRSCQQTEYSLSCRAERCRSALFPGSGTNFWLA